MAGFYSSAARSSDLTQAAAFPVSDPTSGRRTCKGWPTPAIAAKISRSSHGPEKGPGKGVGHATAKIRDISVIKVPSVGMWESPSLLSLRNRENPDFASPFHSFRTEITITHPPQAQPHATRTAHTA